MNSYLEGFARTLKHARLSAKYSYIVQRSDGMSWVGPDYRRGITFSNVDRWVCRFDDKRSAINAVKSSGIEKWLEDHRDNTIALLADGTRTMTNDGTVKLVRVLKID